MSGLKTIVIVFHETPGHGSMHNYRIWHCAQIWKRSGFKVQMLRGFNEPVQADLLIPQIDLSVLPKACRHLLRSEAIVVNRSVVDIRKSVFSRNLVSIRDHYHGPVIVKTNANAGGWAERSLIRTLPFHEQILKRACQLSRAIRKVAISGSLSRLAYASTLTSDNYPVFASKHQVPRGVFKNEDLVVEKFLPEKQGRFYYLRSYTFFGNEGLAVRTKSEFPMVKGASGTDLDFVPVDDAIVTARNELGFDYGKFDYVIHDGEAVLLDINTTPTFGKAYSPEVRSKIVTQLAKGVSKWFPDQGT